MAVDIDPFEKADRVRKFKETNGFNWPMVVQQTELAVGYNVRVQSTKFGIDKNGVIVLKGSYGTQSVQEWERWLRVLSQE